ncbi:phage integrase [Paraburkholderia sp. PGU19]|uniref:tyrosine-type recombinase/integrase n=1 Tax=Paraburkholderia sp. PGU19 TaxID=2735434 RepID=UPI0015D9DF82|nr:site-specific integrase [Paraburkholderia sp. PGU19]BCG00234.1 phage integrase [Paraburkholderia sp. PGU19]
MPRTTHRLTAQAVKSVATPGCYADGGNLHLQVSPALTKSWLFKYTLHGRSREMGLGSLNAVPLSEARVKAGEARRLLAAGKDPLAEKSNARRTAQRDADLRLTFLAAATQYVALRSPDWSQSNITAWTGSIRLHAKPLLALDVATIETTDVLRTLEPLWMKKNATAAQLRGRIESILDWATSRGSRQGPNPARWDDHLQHLLPAAKAATTHRAALHWTAMPALMARLRADTSPAAPLLMYLALTGVRSREAGGATWKEIDLDSRTWRVPGPRMKGRKEHWVPLSDQAIELLKALPGAHRADDLVFMSAKGKEISGTVLRDTLSAIAGDLGECTPHGLRSSLRTWISETTATPSDVAESVLAHDSRGDVRKVYERTRFFEQRVPLMQRWADFLDSPAADVLPFTAAR